MPNFLLRAVKLLQDVLFIIQLDKGAHDCRAPDIPLLRLQDLYLQQQVAVTNAQLAAQMLHPSMALSAPPAYGCMLPGRDQGMVSTYASLSS